MDKRFMRRIYVFHILFPVVLYQGLYDVTLLNNMAFKWAFLKYIGPDSTHRDLDRYVFVSLFSCFCLGYDQDYYMRLSKRRVDSVLFPGAVEVAAGAVPTSSGTATGRRENPGNLLK